MSAMQIAGTTCGVCSGRIAAEGDGLGCALCRATFHRSCLVPAGRCRTCHADLELATEDAEVRARTQVRDQLARGRLQVLLVIALVLFFPALQLILVTVASIYAPGSLVLTPYAGAQALGVFVLHLAIAAGLYYGSPGLLRFLRIALGLACVLEGLAVWRDVAAGLLPIATLRAMDVVPLVVAFLVLTTSKSAEVFLHRRLLRDTPG